MAQTTTESGDRPLGGREKRTLALLGLPTLALALGATVVTTYLPVIARPIVGSDLVVGLIIGIEGLLALWLPLLAGAWSDRLRTRWGGRLPFMAVGAPILVAGLLIMSMVGSGATLALAVLVFFAGYFVVYEPYRALYPDAVPDEIEGRAQGTQALWRGLGTGLALLGGGLLLSFGRGTPFLVAIIVVVAALGSFGALMLRRGVPEQAERPERPVREEARYVWELVRGSGELRAYLTANGLWEVSLGALKTFVVLYVTEGLGFSRVTASLMIGGVAVLVLLAALGGGRLADRYGNVTVLRVALPLYGIGLIGPLLSSDHVVVAACMPFIAVGAGAVMALPYALLIPLMPDADHGTLTGAYEFSRGVGTWIGPLAAGAAITLLHGVFSATQGYQAVWGVCSLAVLLSLLPLRRLRRLRDERP